MNHSEVKKHLADYLEGDIDLAARALVDAHLDGCAECAQEVTEMQQTIRLLRMLPEPSQPPMVAANVMRRVRAGETEPGFFERIGRVLGGIFEPTFVLPASAVAAAAFVVVIVQEPGGLSGLLNSNHIAGQDAGAGIIATEQAANPLPATAAVPVPLSRLAMNAGASIGNGPTAPSTRYSGTRTSGATRAQLSPPRSYGAPAAQEFLAASDAYSGTAGAAPRVYSDVGVDSGLRNVRSESRSGAQARPNAVPSGAMRTETRVRTRIQIDRNGRPVATFVQQPQGGTTTRSRAPNSLLPAHANGLVGGAVPVAGAVSNSLKAQALAPNARGAGGVGASDASSGGEDVRDLWLARGLEDPVGFAHFIAERNLAEQELWVSRLSARASERGVLADLLMALRASGDDTAAWVADDFSAGQGR